MLSSDFLFILPAYLLLAFLQLTALPYLIFLSKKFPSIGDGFWAFGRFWVLLILAFLVWTLAFLKIPVNQPLPIFLLLLVFATGAFFLWQKGGKQYWQSYLKPRRRVILFEELIFFLCFLFLTWTRAFQPDILGLEKFMDAGFVQAYLKSATLPATDMWLAGEGINYYTFGQFTASVLLQIWHIDLRYGYNLLLAAWLAFFSVGLFSLAYNWRLSLPLQKKKGSFLAREHENSAILAGFFAVLLVSFGGNGHLWWYLWNHQSLTDYWYPDATRFIERTIHEFPTYSFIVSDLHAHVLNLPVVLSLLLLLFLFYQQFHSFLKQKQQNFWRSRIFFLSGAIGFAFAVSVMSNTWDVLSYGLLLIGIGFLSLWQNRKALRPLFFAAIIVVAVMLLGSLPWYLHFESIAGGLAFAQERSPFWQLLVLWGIHFAIALFLLIFLFFAKQKKWLRDRSSFPFFILVFVLITFLIAFPEFAYFKDIYTTYPRANTMFKMLFQAFVLMGLLVSIFLSVVLSFFPQFSLFSSQRALTASNSLLENFKKQWFFYLKRYLLLYLPVFIFLVGSVLYGYQGYRSYYGNWRNFQGIDGLAWLRRKYPDDYALVMYLKENESQQVPIVEAVGDSYTEFDRVSAFTGMPTIVGWRVHEWLWRGSWNVPTSRGAEVDEIYRHPNSQKASQILQKYQIKYIVVGDKEREAYPEMDLQALLSLGTTTVRSGKSYLIQLY